MHVDRLATVYITAVIFLNGGFRGSIHKHSCNHRRHSFHSCYPARQFRDGDPAAPGLTEIQTLPPVLYLDLDALVGRRAQDARGQSTRVLSELLWSAFAHSLVDHLGSRPRLRLRPAPM